MRKGGRVGAGERGREGRKELRGREVFLSFAREEKTREVGRQQSK